MRVDKIYNTKSCPKKKNFFSAYNAVFLLLIRYRPTIASHILVIGGNQFGMHQSNSAVIVFRG